MENNIYKFINKDDYNDIIFVNIIPKYKQDNICYWRHNDDENANWIEMKDINTINIIDKDDDKLKTYKQEFRNTIEFVNIKNKKLWLDIEVIKDSSTDLYYGVINGGCEYIKMENKNRIKLKWDDTPYEEFHDKGEYSIWESTNTKEI